MSTRADPVALLAGGVVVIGGCVALWWASASGSDAPPAPAPAPQPRPAAEDRPAPGPPPAPSPPPAEQPSAAPGWVPASARDVVGRDHATEQLPDGPPCQDRPSPVDLVKDVAGQFEAELRKATAISDGEESAMGERLEREAASAPPFRGKWDLPADRARFGSYVQDMVDLLAKQTTRQGLRYRIHVVRDRSFNAFALPGGVLAIHTAVLEGPMAVHSEAELAAVLGHELAHVERRHPVAAYQYAKAMLGESADDAAILVHMLQTPIQSEYEHEADARGIELAAAAQYDPFAACRLWQRHAAAEPEEAGVGGLIGDVLGQAERALHSHPPSYQRCARTREHARQVHESVRVDTWYRGERNVHDHVIGPKHPF